jgi:MEDS: MEthanogen/methylotroph, DcmR Sensory domain
METETRKTGIDVVGDMVAWGAHFCLFYETKADLLDTLISYCKSGLENQEYCMWIVADPLTVEEARDALKDAVPELDRYLAESRLEIARARDWFLPSGTFDGNRVTGGWYEKLARVSARGYAGIRVTGDTTWLTKKDWRHFCDYEDGLNEVIGNQRLAVLCTYPLAGCGAPQILDVVRTHQFVLARRHGSWDIVETAALNEPRTKSRYSMRSSNNVS